MREVGERAAVPTRTVAAGGDQPAEAHACEHDVERQRVTVPLERVVDLPDRRAALDHNSLPRLVRQVHRDPDQPPRINQNVIVFSKRDVSGPQRDLRRSGVFGHRGCSGKLVGQRGRGDHLVLPSPTQTESSDASTHARKTR